MAHWELERTAEKCRGVDLILGTCLPRQSALRSGLNGLGGPAVTVYASLSPDSSLSSSEHCPSKRCTYGKLGDLRLGCNALIKSLTPVGLGRSNWVVRSVRTAHGQQCGPHVLVVSWSIHVRLDVVVVLG